MGMMEKCPAAAAAAVFLELCTSLSCVEWLPLRLSQAPGKNLVGSNNRM